MHSRPESSCDNPGDWSSFLEDLKRWRAEALGADNRYFFHERYDRPPTDDEALDYYEDHGVPVQRVF